jgi:hypothetical protein
MMMLLLLLLVKCQLVKSNLFELKIDILASCQVCYTKSARAQLGKLVYE